MVLFDEALHVRGSLLDEVLSPAGVAFLEEASAVNAASSIYVLDHEPHTEVLFVHREGLRWTFHTNENGTVGDALSDQEQEQKSLHNAAA